MDKVSIAAFRAPPGLRRSRMDILVTSRGVLRGSALFDGDRLNFLVGGEALKYLQYAVLHEGGHAFR